MVDGLVGFKKDKKLKKVTNLILQTAKYVFCMFSMCSTSP